MSHFFIPPGSKVGERITLPPAEAHHVRDVFRLGIGQTLKLSDGAGHAFEGEIASLGREGVTVLLRREIPSSHPSSSLTLALALLKRDKMEFCIQKAAELGVASLQPMTTTRTIAKPTGSDKMIRWQKIADEAAKQCGRSTRMVVERPMTFMEALKKPGRKILFWEGSTESLRNKISPKSVDVVLIGPEGGFSQEEVREARDAGCKILSLGRNILRAETAAIVATALIQYELDTF